MAAIPRKLSTPLGKSCYFSTFSPEHGIYVMLMMVFFTGAVTAQQWTWATTLAFLCVWVGFQMGQNSRD
ncbi:MAG: YwiC-like family protein [Leptolyngbya sp. SIO3F4]|nr:YwiC-like family protein [Leptolyngbya sp. SIO3F4]